MLNPIYPILLFLALLAAGFFAARFLLLKSEVTRFVREVRESEKRGCREPIRVDSFGKTIISLANALNRHINLQRTLAEEYAEEKRSLSYIISGISHDFRTPLTAALGYLQLIEKNGGLSEKNREYLAVVREKNLYLKRLSDDFFEISRSDGGGEPPQWETVDLGKLLSETLLAQFGWISERGLQTRFEIGEPILLESDRHMLERILENLFSNAEKYAEKSLFVALSDEGEAVLLTVGNGCSPEEERDEVRVFEPFYRAASRSKSGAGLGLYVVKRLTERLGGSVGASVKPEEFTVTLRFGKMKR